MSQSAKSSKKSHVLVKHQDNSRHLLLAATAALVLGGGAIAGWFLTRPALDKILPTGYQVLPANVLITVSVSTEPTQWQQLRSQGTSESRAMLDRMLADWQDQFLTRQGLDFARDIQPWVGSEVTLAVMPESAKASSPTSPLGVPMVAVVPVANPVQALQSLRTSSDRGGVTWKERDYNGTKLRESQGNADLRLSMTVLDNRFLVLATSPKLIEQVVDTVKSGITLRDTPGYQSAWQAVHDPKAFANVFVNVPLAATQVAAKPASPVKPEAFAQTQQNQGFVLSAVLAEQSVQIKGLSWLKADSKRRLAVYNNARLIPNILPDSTYMFLSGGNLKQTWQDYDQGADSNSLAPIPPARLKDGLKTLADLDFDQDVLSWMGGEYALALIAAPASQSARNSGTGVALFAQASDRRGAEQFFQKLNQAVTTRYQFQSKEQQVQGQTVTTWLDQNNRLVATHGWLENNIAFLTAGAPVSETFVPKPTAPLAASEAFLKGVPVTLNPNNGHFFLDMTKTIKNPMPSLPFLPSGNPWVQAMDSIGVTAAVRDERSSRFDVEIKLKKSGDVPPFASPDSPTQTQPSPSATPTGQ